MKGRPTLWHWPPALEAQLVARFLAGAQVKAIARELERPKHAIACRINHLRDEGRLPYRYKPWSPDDDRALWAAVDRGESYRIIAKRLRRSKDACKQRLCNLRAAASGFENRDQLQLELQAA